MGQFLYIGVDTSCYTTSLAVLDEDGRLMADKRIVLPVALGEHGLRQRDGVFYHVRNLTQLLEQADLPEGQIKAVGVSSQPRPVEGSYMPVFLAGVAVAMGMTAASRAPLFQFSHQEGHIAAGIDLARLHMPFLAVHLSGGTTEALRVTPKAGVGFDIDLLAATSDLSAGQMIDRVGVALGLPFPAGPHLERLALGATGRLSLASAPARVGFSFSGPCSAALRLVEQGEDTAEIAFATLRVVANSLEKVLRAIVEEEGLRQVLMVGGVMSNQLIRRRLSHRLQGFLTLEFIEPHLCTDNAVGVAKLAREKFLRQGGGERF